MDIILSDVLGGKGDYFTVCCIILATKSMRIETLKKFVYSNQERTLEYFNSPKWYRC